MRSLGMLVYFLGGMVALFINILIIKEVLGVVGVILGIVLFPFLITIAPWYALFAWGHWTPLLITYGTMIIGTGFMAIGGEE